VTTLDPIDDLLRPLGPWVLGQLIRRYGEFASCEDAVQEALLAAATQWPDEGVPANPKSWLITVATRRLTDEWRRDTARRHRETAAAQLMVPDGLVSRGPEEDAVDFDDSLTLLLLCCHPALSTASQMALTLRAVGGLTTAEIARALLTPDVTIGQRISRAKQSIRAAGGGFPMSPGDERDRLPVVLHVLYLIFNEGYTASSGTQLQRPDLTREAIRLARILHRQLPADGEIAGLLALMLLTEARRLARTGPCGVLVPLPEQDRSKWDQALITEGIALVTSALSTAPLGPYQLQAAIAAVHDEAATAEDTDWAQILLLYELLENRWPSPVVRLNRAVALGMVRGPQAGLEVLRTLEADPRMAEHHRLHAVRAHLLVMASDYPAAHSAYEAAARRATSLPERDYLEAMAARFGLQNH
jgi:RNA polymerase sigma factor (sigma-70 family)